MRNYIVYIKGEEQSDLLKAGSQCSAEKKAAKKYKVSQYDVQCVYTEI